MAAYHGYLQLIIERAKHPVTDQNKKKTLGSFLPDRTVLSLQKTQ